MTMNIYVFIGSIVLTVLSLALIIVVLLQEGSETSLSGAIGGNSDSFYGKNKGRTLDAFLNKWTKIIAICFFVVALVCDVLMFL